MGWEAELWVRKGWWGDSLLLMTVQRPHQDTDASSYLLTMVILVLWTKTYVQFAKWQAAAVPYCLSNLRKADGTLCVLWCCYQKRACLGELRGLGPGAGVTVSILSIFSTFP